MFAKLTQDEAQTLIGMLRDGNASSREMGRDYTAWARATDSPEMRNLYNQEANTLAHMRTEATHICWQVRKEVLSY